ncbi:MAG: alanine:cation symporter family protein [Bacteroidetes bacterium]|nr:alanine:cation symporter family protein [Bacteroidota bacterium]
MKNKHLIILLSIILLVSCRIFAQTQIATNDTIKEALVVSEQIIAEPEAQTEKTLSERINDSFVPIVEGLGSILNWDPFSASGVYDPTIYDAGGEAMVDETGETRTAPIPLIMVWLICGALFFTIFLRFINFRGFKHAIDIVRGRYDDPNQPGEVSHFQALTTALSATVGLGNIAGVAIAISIGGPGATFWMIVAGFLGMSSKFVECTLGVKYRKIDKFGVVSGGPMYYLRDGLAKKNMKWLGIVLAFIFAILVIGGSFGGGNMFQANQAFSQLVLMAPSIAGYGAYFGIILAVLVGIVIIGGIKSIARVTDKIVPIMAVFYVGTAMIIIIMNLNHASEAFGLIFSGAFAPAAIKGGVIGVLIVGFQRASFSNEAGVGSAAIAHSAVKTDRPISEGFVSLLGPFIDTVVICTMTALVIIFTGQYTNPSGLEGTQLTSAAFGTVFSWFPYLLVLTIFLFAFSTMISWSYYGLKGFDYLVGGIFEKWFGNRKIAATIFRLMFLGMIVVGSSSTLGVVVDFSDMMILSMGFPNILGLIILAPEIKRDLKVYWQQVKSGEIKRFK